MIIEKAFLRAVVVVSQPTLMTKKIPFSIVCSKNVFRLMYFLDS